MPALLYGRGAYKRNAGDMPELRLVNLFSEASPTAEEGVILQSRRGLASHSNPGTGPINGIFSAPNVFGGAIFTISNNTLYINNTSLGTITGTGPISWAASDTEVVVTRGGLAYSYNGTDLAPITFPDSANVRAVAYIASLFVFIRDLTHKFYWSATLDARTVGALDFASAELRPDSLLDVVSVAGTLYLIGEDNIEPWFPSGNADLPFTRIDQRLTLKGAKATGCTREVEGAVIFVANDNCTYTLAGGIQKVSNNGIDERVGESSTISTFAYTFDGHSFFCIRLDEGTYCFDATTNEWCEFASYGRDNWRAKCATNVGAIPYFGDDETDNVWTFGDVFQDNGTVLEGYFTGLLPIGDGTVSFNNVAVRANVGRTNPIVGDDSDPILEMRASQDAGASFGNWRQTTLGQQGRYRNRAVFRRCGTFSSPGALFEFRITDQSPRRVSGVYYNDPGGGRSR